MTTSSFVVCARLRCYTQAPAEASRRNALRNHCWHELNERIKDVRVHGAPINIQILLSIVAKTKFNRHATRNANKDPIFFSSQHGTERNCSKLRRAVIEQRCAPDNLFLTTHNFSHERARGCTMVDASLGVRGYEWRHRLPRAWRGWRQKLRIDFPNLPHLKPKIK